MQRGAPGSCESVIASSASRPPPSPSTPGAFAEAAKTPSVQAIAAGLRNELGPDRTIVLGVDRLDYTKGIDVRLRAFETLLATHQANDSRLCPDRGAFTRGSQRLLGDALQDRADRWSDQWRPSPARAHPGSLPVPEPAIRKTWSRTTRWRT